MAAGVTGPGFHRVMRIPPSNRRQVGSVMRDIGWSE